jgi:nicotinamidase-related amidase
MLIADDVVLIVIDVQGKLARIVADSSAKIKQIEKLIKGFNILSIPILLTSQVPEKIGYAIPEIRNLIPHHFEIPRTSFSVIQNLEVMRQLGNLNKKKVILCGFEAHICLFQSTKDLISTGFEIFWVVDAISSRDLFNMGIAMKEVTKLGVHFTTVEMVLFELLKNANHPAFREILKIIQ